MFLFEDKRAKYLLDDLKLKLPVTEVFQVRVKWTEFFFWINLFLTFINIVISELRRGKLPKINQRLVYINATRRPNFVKKMSEKSEAIIDSLCLKPDLILQWSSAFAPYVGHPSIPFALIIDNYSDPPKSTNQKDKMRGWSTIYNTSFFEFQNRLYHDAVFIFTLSKWCREGLIKEYNIKPEKVFTIGWGPAKKLGLTCLPKKESKTIIAIGKNYVDKGIDILLEVADLLPDFLITIVGEDKCFRNCKKQNVQVKANLSDEELLDIFRRTELFFIFSSFEPSAHVLWEAQSNGCVVIGYDAYGTSEAIIHRRTGLLLKTREPLEIAREICSLYTQDGLLDKMRENALENYRTNGTWGRVSDTIVKVLNQPLE